MIVLFAIGTTIYCVVAARKRRTGVKESAYRSIYASDSKDNSHSLYGHDEESKYSDPYQDRA